MASLDSAHWELGEAFEGLPDEETWKRPSPRLLSAGELAAHLAYWEAKSFFGEAFESLLVVPAARYYTSSVETPFALPLGAQEVLAEVRRVHEACKATFLAAPPALEAINAHRNDWTWGETLQYLTFHVAYHTGQVYSVRHLLGHQTVDN